MCKSDSEIVKTKARHMLVEKDREIEQLKGIVAQEDEEDEKVSGESGASHDKMSNSSLKSAEKQ